jgi:SAM-dependent methyltransferase
VANAFEARDRWRRSSEAWIQHLAREDVNRTLILDPPMLEYAGDVAGRSVLDVGCGEGRFCRMLAGRGAAVVGVDPTPEFLAEARERDPAGRYVRGVGEALPFADARFDLLVAYLSLIDMPDFRAAIGEMARVARPGGHLLIANLNSFATTRPRAWYQDERGEKLHVAVEDYFDERTIDLEWSGISIVNWHRPFEAYVGALLEQGLVLEAFAEPRPCPDAVARHPAMRDEYRVPLFHVMRWRKGEGCAAKS